ncbi:SAM-dependent methyltransferase [Kribbella sandramycini]|uniref:SAM-dependent methyltransferase n=1 Tax=Kribbella sandramycini TaxID=60450 RepID=A0A7Y4L4Z2_9ACTN|nr:SAM-dependent methyltransferase [Kribbella sandramycini]MBB6571833.1 SAM-dependent methyltransferase [Kribbella sandramycini]NOL44475.1 SAM-dependent methyltransferase [Kribbella sandramycini]
MQAEVVPGVLDEPTAQAVGETGAWEAIRAALLDRSGLVRAVASGRRRGLDQPPYQRLELRYVDLKGQRHLQLTEYDERQAHTRNVPAAEAAALVGELLTLPYGTWHVETTTETLRLRYTKKGKELLHRQAESREQVTGHDRVKQRVLDPAAPFLVELGISDHQGRVKPSRQAKYKQIEEFCKLLEPALEEALGAGRIATGRPLQVVDLGCGNAYLTLAAYHLLTAAGHDVRMTGVDHNPAARTRNTKVVTALGWQEHLRFVDATIQGAELDVQPDVVLALHACDTATDDALARAVRWEAPLVLAAPCCHHDIQKQLKSVSPPAPYALMTRYGIVRERFADILTDTFRAAVLRQLGYRVEVVQFVDSQHTPRNLLLRAARTNAPVTPDLVADYDALAATWQVHPRLAQLLLPARPAPAEVVS